MKFYNPKTHELFKDIMRARACYCEDNTCSNCKVRLYCACDGLKCGDYCESYPVEAAQLMGLKVLDDIPVLCGWWEKLKPGSAIIYCSVCESEAYWDTDFGQQKFPYCPYCGARMGGPGHD